MKSNIYIIILTLFMSSCSFMPWSSDEGDTSCIDNSVYMIEGDSEQLQVPEGLENYDYSGALHIPTQEMINNQDPLTCLEIPPSYE